LRAGFERLQPLLPLNYVQSGFQSHAKASATWIPLDGLLVPGLQRECRTESGEI
jgi:hypothetical protein